MNTRNVKQLKVLIFSLVTIITLGIGYVGITAINLVINGDATASVNNQNFNVKFLSEENVTPTITGEGNTESVKDDITAKFSVSTLTGLGDSEVATFIVKNESSGFVVEFVDCITEMQMRNTNTNVGGYPATLVFDYLNNTLLGQLPSDLQSVIEPTKMYNIYNYTSFSLCEHLFYSIIYTNGDLYE